MLRKLLNLPPCSSASLVFETHNVFNFEVLIQSKVFFFSVERLEKVATLSCK